MTLCLKSDSAGSLGMSMQSPVDVELPAVVHAAQAGLLVASEEQRRAAMRAVVGCIKPDLAVGVAESDQLLAQQQHSHRIAVRLRAARDDSMAGIQYWRMNLPIGVPGPVRQISSFSSRLSMDSLPFWRSQVGYVALSLLVLLDRRLSAGPGDEARLEGGIQVGCEGRTRTVYPLSPLPRHSAA